MNTKFFGIAALMLLLTFLNGTIKFTKSQKPQHFAVIETPQQSGEAFYKSQCGFCHTKEELIAPDMNKIKAAYLKKYSNKAAFIKAVTAFVKNPNKKNAIYKEGINNFTDMPKMPFKDAEINAVADYIYSATNL